MHTTGNGALQMAMENLMDLINYEHSVSCSQLADEYRYRQLALSALDENHLGSNAAWVELRAWHNAERRQLSELHTARVQTWFDCNQTRLQSLQ